MSRGNLLHSAHRGILNLFNIGSGAFFIIAVVLAFILVNVGLAVLETEKEVVVEGMNEADDTLMIVGRIAGSADVESNELVVTSTPVRSTGGGSINADPQIMEMTYTLIQSDKVSIKYDNIYVGNLQNVVYNSLTDAVADAKQQGLIDINPFVDKQKPTSSDAFVYWVKNYNFDQFIDDGELAVIAVIFADGDRPSAGDQFLFHTKVAKDLVLKIEREVPNMSTTIMSFGGKVVEP